MYVISFALIQQRCSRARSSQWTTCKPRNSQQQEDRCWSSGVGRGGCSGRKFQLTLWRPRCKLRRGQRRVGRGQQGRSKGAAAAAAAITIGGTAGGDDSCAGGSSIRVVVATAVAVAVAANGGSGGNAEFRGGLEV